MPGRPDSSPAGPARDGPEPTGDRAVAILTDFAALLRRGRRRRDQRAGRGLDAAGQALLAGPDRGHLGGADRRRRRLVAVDRPGRRAGAQRAVTRCSGVCWTRSRRPGTASSWCAASRRATTSPGWTPPAVRCAGHWTPSGTASRIPRSTRRCGVTARSRTWTWPSTPTAGSGRARPTTTCSSCGPTCSACGRRPRDASPRTRSTGSRRWSACSRNSPGPTARCPRCTTARTTGPGAHREVLEICVLAPAVVDDGLRSSRSRAGCAGGSAPTTMAWRTPSAAGSPVRRSPWPTLPTARIGRISPDAGYVVLRDPADTVTAILDAGPHGGSHGHLDKLGALPVRRRRGLAAGAGGAALRQPAAPRLLRAHRRRTPRCGSTARTSDRRPAIVEIVELGPGTTARVQASAERRDRRRTGDA